jgi:predicted RNA methylase
LRSASDGFNRLGGDHIYTSGAGSLVTPVVGSSRTFGRPLSPETRILDFGCGWGRILRFFLKDVPAKNLIGVDVDPEVIEICKETIREGRFEIVPIAHAARSARQHPDLHPYQRRQDARGQHPRSVAAEPGAFYIMDRGFLDFERLYRFHEAGSFFVTRGKSNLKIQRRYSHPVDRATGLICDQTVLLTGFYSRKGFEAPLRRIRFKDPETEKTLIFLTNNFALPALTITELYRCRWQVELFFKWIKQHLRIKAFFGTSENAVKSQIWIAVSVYVLVAIIKKRLKLPASLYEILQILSLTMFERTPLDQLLTRAVEEEISGDSRNQLNLFE